jgi:YD repeat-containing protein
VVTSRSKRRIEGNDLDKADKVVFQGGVLSYIYHAAGEVLQYEDALGHAVRCERDAEGRLRAVVDPLGARTEYLDDEQGALVETRDALGGFARYVRNAQGDVTAVMDDLGLVAEFRYDDRGLLIEGALPNGGVTRMEHDGLANRVKVIEPDGATRKIRYDFLGRVMSWVEPVDVTWARSYGWSASGLLSSVGGEARGAYTAFARDADGRVTSRERVEGERRERVESFRHEPGGALHDGRAERRYGPGARLSARGRVRFAYDSRGRVSHKYVGDEPPWRLEWGDDDLLQAARLPDGRVVRFEYDPFARMLEKRIERDGKVESMTRYAWSGDALVHEVRAPRPRATWRWSSGRMRCCPRSCRSCSARWTRLPEDANRRRADLRDVAPLTARRERVGAPLASSALPGDHLVIHGAPRRPRHLRAARATGARYHAQERVWYGPWHAALSFSVAVHGLVRAARLRQQS